MGTDIHLLAERQTDNGWEVVPGPVVPCDMCDFYKGRECYYCKNERRRRVQWYDDRHYVIFAALADVRNGYGFAGIPTHESLQPISPPRGRPADLSAEADEWLEDHGDHSDTWLSMEEINAYDWDQIIVPRNGEPFPLREAASTFLASMESLQAEAGDMPTRIVFNFDS